MKRARFARYDHRNPTTDDYLIAGLGVALFAGLAALVYVQSLLNDTAEAAPATPLQGNTSQGEFVNTGSGWLGGGVVSQGSSIQTAGLQPGEAPPVPVLPLRGAPQFTGATT